MLATARRLLVAGLLAIGLGLLVGCSAAGGGVATLPADLPPNPEPGVDYCRVWVPPVTRKVPRLVMVKGPCTREVPVEGTEIRWREECIKPREVKHLCTPGSRCEQAVVQTTPGGYRWRQQPDGCWKYVYEQPCYEWCNKVVTEDGIEYCAEVPPEYEIVAERERVVRTRTEYIPAQYDVVWEEEVYQEGYWAWKPKPTCSEEGACAPPCPPVRFERKPCVDVGVTPDCPRTN